MGKIFILSPASCTGLRARMVLKRDARAVEKCAGDADQVILLGSIAGDKYRDILVECFGHRLKFPAAFVGRGDMSRGGLLLRHSEERRELDYISVEKAVLRGRRPAKLEPRTGRAEGKKGG